MGFLSGLLGVPGKDKQFNRCIKRVYKGLNPDRVHMIFPGGEEQVKKIIKSIALILQEDPFKYNEARCERILRLYLAILKGSYSGMVDDDELRSWMLTKESDIVKEENVDKLILYAVMNRRNMDYEVASLEDVGLNFMSDYLANAKGIQKQNTAATHVYIDDVDYGLIMGKPIYTKMVTGSDEYLSKLRTTDGEELTYNRVGSYDVEGINGLVDRYDMYLQSGKMYRSIYINMYSQTNSITPPAGFIIVKG